MKGRIFIALGLVAGLLLALTIGLLVFYGANKRPDREPVSEESAGSVPGGDLWSGFGDSPEPPPGLIPPGTKEGDAPPAPAIDLDGLRAEMPDNLYWKMLAPTTDPALTSFREREKKKWNDEYGKVLSNTATVNEIQAYYAYRKKLSEDYILFAQRLLDRYGDQLSEREEGLIKLGLELHVERIKQTPADLRRALEHKAAYETKKRDWQAGKTAR